VSYLYTMHGNQISSLSVISIHGIQIEEKQMWDRNGREANVGYKWKRSKCGMQMEEKMKFVTGLFM
jgi:hypothetical protein